MGGHRPLPCGRGLPGREEAQGRRGWGRLLSPSPRGLISPRAKSSPAQSFLPQSRRRLGPWVGGLGSRPDLTRSALPPAPRPSPSLLPRPSREPQPGRPAPATRSPGRGGRGHGRRRRGRACGLGFRGSRWERAWKEQMPPLPTGRARRSPALHPACSCRLLPRCAARARGRRHLGHRALSDSRDVAPASPEGSSPASCQASGPRAWLKDVCLLAAQEFP